MQSGEQIQLIQLLLSRLERVSADSYWAHRASGVRGALLKELEKMEAGQEIEESRLRQLTETGFMVLRSAAEKQIS